MQSSLLNSVASCLKMGLVRSSDVNPEPDGTHTQTGSSKGRLSMRLRAMLILASVALLAPAQVRADVKPHALCTEGMVLQQKAETKIWGKADPDEAVTVSFRGQKVATKADAKGNWSVALKANGAGGPFEMTIAGKNTIEYKNVLVGEVWVCSGQSNMEQSVNGSDKADQESARSAPHNPMLRMFQVARTPFAGPQTETSGKWVEADAKVVGNWTAVGYFFGRDLQTNLKIPVALIQSAWGGTRAEAWTSPEALAASPNYKNEIDGYLKANPDPNKSEKNPNAPAVLHNGMIHPLLNYRIQGAIWYQGESNAGKAFAYRELFPMMIQNWRHDWNQPEFPFLFVQLAPFTAVRKDPGPSSWAELREAQLMTLKLRNTGQAVITDYGHEADIHPTTAGIYVATMMAQADILRERGHPYSEIVNESIIEAIDSLNPYMDFKDVAYMVDNCSTTARLGARKWAPRFDYAVTQTVLPALGQSQAKDEALFARFLDSKVHEALAVCLDLRPPVAIAVMD